jgi:pSer/pThr/pTyr-binding forkhead associated (FHA) protein
VRTNAEYWCPHTLLVTVDGPQGRSSVKVEKPYARIGAHQSAEIFLPGGGTAYHSLYLHATDAGVFFVALGPTDVPNDQPRGWLRPGQVILLGPYRITAELADAADLPGRPQRDLEMPEPAALAFPRVTVSVAGQEIAHYPLRRALTLIGRGRRNAIQVADAQVSTLHCALYREADHLWVIDLLSANGTMLEGARVEAAAVTPGKSIRLGGVELTFAPPNGNREEPGPATVADMFVATNSGRAARAVRPPAKPENREPKSMDLEDDLDELPHRLAGRMIDYERHHHRRRRLRTLAITVAAIMAIVAGGLLLYQYGEDLLDFLR